MNFKGILLTFLLSMPLSSAENSMLGYWLTSESIVHVKKCEEKLCATIEHIFVDEDIDPETIKDENNRDKSLRNRSLIGINLLDDFIYENSTELNNGRIYDPNRVRFFKSNLYLLETGELKVEGCLLRLCQHVLWQELEVSIDSDGNRAATLKK